MKVSLRYNSHTDMYYFVVDILNIYVCTSAGITEKFNIAKEEFKKILTTEVIKHNDFSIYVDEEDEDGVSFDIEFKVNNTPREIYVERFKEAFAPQLTMLSLGGSLNESETC